MGQYIVRRILISLPVWLGITVIAFFLMHLAPGGPGEVLLSPNASPAQIAQFQKNLGLDQPLPIQYIDWLGQILQGNFGTSFSDGSPVLPLILARMPNTILLMATALFLTYVISLPLGIISAVRQYSWADTLITLLSFVGMSMPEFWLGFIVIIIFAVQLRWFPVGGMYTLGAPFSLSNRIMHLILPASVLAIGGIAGHMRYIRSSMLEVIHQDFIRTAEAKGASKFAIYYKHALRNALIPVVTIMGMGLLPSLFAGALLIEKIFAWPGVGRLLYSAAMSRDYPVLMGGIVIASSLVILGNLIADVVYTVLDPRIKFD